VQTRLNVPMIHSLGGHCINDSLWASIILPDGTESSDRKCMIARPDPHCPLEAPQLGRGKVWMMKGNGTMADPIVSMLAAIVKENENAD